MSEVIDISPDNLDSSLCFIQPGILHDVLYTEVEYKFVTLNKQGDNTCLDVILNSFPNLEPVCCSMSSSNCCFLTCIQVSQEAGKVVWYSPLFKNFPQFVVVQSKALV